MNTDREILLAEDDDVDVALMQRALRDVAVLNPLVVAHHGREAIEFLERRCANGQDRLPALVILDLKMPLRSGIEVLQWMRKQPALRCLPVLMFSSSAHRDDIERAYAIGANAFIIKPASMARRREIAQFVHSWLRLVHPPLAVTEGPQAAQMLRLGTLRAEDS